MAVTITEVKHGSVTEIKFAWTSAAGGTTSGTTVNYYNGKVIGLTTVPGTGASEPTELYDLTVTDRRSRDVLENEGANKSNLTTEYVAAPNLGMVVESRLTINVSNAGNTNSGTAYVYIR